MSNLTRGRGLFEKLICTPLTNGSCRVEGQFCSKSSTAGYCRSGEVVGSAALLGGRELHACRKARSKGFTHTRCMPTFLQPAWHRRHGIHFPHTSWPSSPHPAGRSAGCAGGRSAECGSCAPGCPPETAPPPGGRPIRCPAAALGGWSGDGESAWLGARCKLGCSERLAP